MSKISEQIVLSTPQTMRDKYPDAGWVSIDGAEPMPQYAETILLPEISGIIREIVTKAEAAIREGRAEPRQPQTINIIRSMSFAVPVDIPLEHLGKGRRGRMPRPSHKEIIELYKRAGWDSVNIENPTWRVRDGIRTILLRLTYWQRLAKKRQ